MEDCIFCTLAKDPEQTSLVYQDGLVYACMDIAPVNPGHVLVVP